MNDKLRILITGFGAFPGAPYNPTMPLVERLLRLRRPAFDDVELSSHIFHVTYATVDRELPGLLRKHRPHALLMFGLAATDFVPADRNPCAQRDHDHLAGRRWHTHPQGIDRARRGRPDVRSRIRQNCCARRWQPGSTRAPRAMPAAISATI